MLSRFSLILLISAIACSASTEIFVLEETFSWVSCNCFSAWIVSLICSSCFASCSVCVLEEVLYSSDFTVFNSFCLEIVSSNVSAYFFNLLSDSTMESYSSCKPGSNFTVESLAISCSYCLYNWIYYFKCYFVA